MWTLTNQPNRPQGEIASERKQCCVFWDQRGVIWYDLIKPGETITGEYYQQQLADFNRAMQEKHPEYQARQH